MIDEKITPLTKKRFRKKLRMQKESWTTENMDEGSWNDHTAKSRKKYMVKEM